MLFLTFVVIVPPGVSKFSTLIFVPESHDCVPLEENKLTIYTWWEGAK